MKLEERLKVLKNLISSKRNQLANVEIARQQLVAEVIGIEANIKLLNDIIKGNSSKKDQKDGKKGGEKQETRAPAN